MEVTPEWVAVVLTLMGMSAGAGAWLQGQRHRSRAAIPIIRANWNVGKKGITAHVTIINRLNEDVYVTTAECPSIFTVVTPSEYDPATGSCEFSYTPQPSPMTLDWLVPALGESTETFTVDGAETRRWLRLTMTSSAKTLQRRRVIVRDSQMQ